MEALAKTVKTIVPKEVKEFGMAKMNELVEFQNKYGLVTPNLNALA